MRRWAGVLVALIAAFALVASVDRDRFRDDETRVAASAQQSNNVEPSNSVLEDSTTTTLNTSPLTQQSSDDRTTTATVVAPTTKTTPPAGSGTTTTTEKALTTATTQPSVGSGTTATTVVVPTTKTTPPADDGTHLLILADTVFNQPIILRPGDTITFANGAELLCGAGCRAEWDGITATGEGNVRFIAGSGVSTITNSVFDLQPSPEPGHYPLHWHLVGDGSRGTLVENVTIRNSTNRAFVPHGSNGITFRNTTALNIVGEAYWWNPPGSTQTCRWRKFCTADNSNDITFDGAVADGITNAVGDSRGYRLSAFQLGAGSGNVIRNSVARNINPTNVKDCSGFKWPETSNQNVGGNVWVFENNQTIDDRCHGIFVWQNDSNLHIIDGFVGPGIDHGAYGNRYDYRNVTVGYLEVHAIGWSMRDSSVGDVTTFKHAAAGTVTFTNVAMDSFTVNNGTGTTARQPATYVLNNVGLDCVDIIYQSVIEGTQVIIDGVTCGP